MDKRVYDHPNVLGAGAKKRRKLNPEDRAHAVMGEFKRGTLHSGSGAIVKKRSQAKAIAVSEAEQAKKRKR